MKARLFSLALASAIFLTQYTIVFADSVDITISGNGAESQSSVNTTSENSVLVVQNNAADITNNTNSSSITGGNSASSNTGDVTIQTGLANISTSVINENVNTNISDGKAGATDISVAIENNGSDSANTGEVNVFYTTQVNETNSAAIVNNATNIGNTGSNIANNNNGDIGIHTGDIMSYAQIVNKDINFSLDPQDNINTISALISGNGTGSLNTVLFSLNNLSNIEMFNHADITNTVFQELVTGANTALNNDGSVDIVTGDILNVVIIENENINRSAFNPSVLAFVPPSVGGPSAPQSEQPSFPSQPLTQVSPASVSGSQESGQGEGAGEILTGISNVLLPTTGGSFTFLFTLASLIMFLMGWYLRLRGGRSPNRAYVTF